MIKCPAKCLVMYTSIKKVMPVDMFNSLYEIFWYSLVHAKFFLVRYKALANDYLTTISYVFLFYFIFGWVIIRSDAQWCSVHIIFMFCNCPLGSIFDDCDTWKWCFFNTRIIYGFTLLKAIVTMLIRQVRQNNDENIYISTNLDEFKRLQKQ